MPSGFHPLPTLSVLFTRGLLPAGKIEKDSPYNETGTTRDNGLEACSGRHERMGMAHLLLWSVGRVRLHRIRKIAQNREAANLIAPWEM